MRSKRIIMALIVAIMIVSAVACGSANKAEESKTTDETTKEVSSTVASTEATTTATEATTQAVTEATTKAKDNRVLVNEVVIEFEKNFKLSDETCKNIKDYLENKVYTKGDIIDYSQISYKPEEYNSMQLFCFGMIDVISHNITSADYMEPFEYLLKSDSELEVSYDSNGITIKKYNFKYY